MKSWPLILVRSEQTGRVTQPNLVDRLGDHPQLLTLAGLVCAQKAAAVDQGGVVEALVIVVEVAPVAGDVPGEELTCRLTGNLKGMQMPGVETILPRLNFFVSV